VTIIWARLYLGTAIWYEQRKSESCGASATNASRLESDLRVLGSVVSSHSGVRDTAPAANDFFVYTLQLIFGH